MAISRAFQDRFIELVKDLDIKKRLKLRKPSESPMLLSVKSIISEYSYRTYSYAYSRLF